MTVEPHGLASVAIALRRFAIRDASSCEVVPCKSPDARSCEATAESRKPRTRTEARRHSEILRAFVPPCESFFHVPQHAPNHQARILCEWAAGRDSPFPAPVIRTFLSQECCFRSLVEDSHGGTEAQRNPPCLCAAVRDLLPCPTGRAEDFVRHANYRGTDHYYSETVCRRIL